MFHLCIPKAYLVLPIDSGESEPKQAGDLFSNGKLGFITTRNIDR